MAINSSINEFLSKTGQYLLTGAKAAVGATNLIPGLFTELLSEVVETGTGVAIEKIDERRLYSSVGRKLEELCQSRGIGFLDELYNDITGSVKPVRAGRLKRGKAFSSLILDNLDQINAESIKGYASVSRLTPTEQGKLVEVLCELKSWLSARCLSMKSTKDKTLALIIAERVGNQIKGDVLSEIRSTLYGKKFKPFEECPECGSISIQNDKETLSAHCPSCGREFFCVEANDGYSLDKEELRQILAQTSSELFAVRASLAELSTAGERVLEALSNGRIEELASRKKNLYNRLMESHPRVDDVKSAASDVLSAAYNDPFADFIYKAAGANRIVFFSALENAEAVSRLTEQEKCLAVDFCLGKAKAIDIPHIEMFINLAFDDGTDVHTYYIGRLHKEAEKIKNDVYNLDKERDAFIMYVTEDLEDVESLVEKLELRGFSCFYSHRNMQHISDTSNSSGYIQKLMRAISHCRTIVFVATANSVTRSGGQIDEMEAWMKLEQEMLTAASSYKMNTLYSDIPLSEKKHRIWYTGGRKAPETELYTIKAFFGDCEKGGVNFEKLCSFIANARTTAPKTDFKIPKIIREKPKPEPIREPKPKPEPKPKREPKPKPIREPKPKRAPKPKRTPRKLSAIARVSIQAVVAVLLTAITVAFPYVLPLSMGAVALVPWIILALASATASVCLARSLYRHKLGFNEGAFDVVTGIIWMAVTALFIVGIARGQQVFPTFLTVIFGVLSIGWILLIAFWSFSDCNIKYVNHLIPFMLLALIVAFSVIPNVNPVVEVGSGIHNDSIGYIEMSDGTAHAYIAEAREQIIFPSEINGKPVTRILATEGVTNGDIIKSITVPTSVTAVELGAFRDCSAIEEITLPFVGGGEGGNDYFGYVFGYENTMFRKQSKDVPSSLKSVVILDGITKIGSQAFEDCSSIESITLPATFEKIGFDAFRSCSSLKSIVIPAAVKKIGTDAFRGCPNCIIYCETYFSPSGWSGAWSSGAAEVVWGYKG